MGSDNKSRSVRGRVVESASVLDGYLVWLQRQALKSATKRVYRRSVASYLEFVAGGDVGGDPLADRVAGAHAMRDFKRARLRAEAAPATVNLELAAIDTLYRSLELLAPAVERVDLPQLAPRALPSREQLALLRAVERQSSPRDAAIVALLLNTALRVSECVALDIGDVSFTARTGEVIVRVGKRDEQRRVPLNRQARIALSRWLDERGERAGAGGVRERAGWAAVGPVDRQAARRARQQCGNRAAIPACLAPYVPDEPRARRTRSRARRGGCRSQAA